MDCDHYRLTVDIPVQKRRKQATPRLITQTLNLEDGRQLQCWVPDGNSAQMIHDENTGYITFNTNHASFQVRPKEIA